METSARIRDGHYVLLYRPFRDLPPSFFGIEDLDNAEMTDRRLYEAAKSIFQDGEEFVTLCWTQSGQPEVSIPVLDYCLFV